MVFFFVGFAVTMFRVGFVVRLMGMVICFWECTFPPLVEIRENPEFHDLMREDKAHWPRCLLWHGWLPQLSAVCQVEVALGDYSSCLCAEWGPADEYDGVAASLVPNHPKVWFDGSLVLNQVTGVSSSGAGFFARQAGDCWSNRRWGHVDGLRSVGAVQSCRVSVLFLDLFSLSRVLRCGVSFLLCSLLELFILVLIIWVLFVMLVGCLMVGIVLFLFELVHDGDLLLLIDRMHHLRGLDTVRITRVKGHADEGMVLDVRVREVDRFGNNSADEAADFGRRRLGNAVIDARRNLSGYCGRWYPVILSLHRFFIAISGAVVNHDLHGGTAPDPLVWSVGARPKRRRLVHAVRDRAFFAWAARYLGFGMGFCACYFCLRC